MNEADGDKDAETPAEPADGGLTAAGHLQAEADAKEQREDRIELAFDEGVFEELDPAIQRGGRQGREVAVGIEEQAEKHENVREQDATDGDAAQSVEGDDSVQLVGRVVGNVQRSRIVIAFGRGLIKLAGLKKLLIWGLVLAGAGTGLWYATGREVPPPPPQILKAAVSRGPITETVQAMGIIEPRRRVNVGSQVSGVVKEIYADFNSVVTEGQLLAEIEPELFEIQVQLQEANIARQKLEIASQEQQLSDQKRQFARIQELFAKDLQNEVQVDAARLAINNREAQIFSAKKQLIQSEAALNAARLNLSYTKIYSPIDGVVINRNIDRGQTVQASLRTPNFFLLSAPFETLRLTAGVDEADIGRVRPGMPVKFRTGTFGQELFDGVVDAVRLNATNSNGVVTYPVWIRVPNEDLRLRPGMTANVFIHVANTLAEVARIPNEALKFRPTSAAYAALGVQAPPTDAVRQVDLDANRVVATTARKPAIDDGEATTIDELFTPLPKEEVKATVWRWNEITRELTPIAIRVGVSDGSMTELLSGDVNVGDQLVTRIVLPNAGTSRLVGEQMKAGIPPTMGQGRGGGGQGGGRGGGS